MSLFANRISIIELKFDSPKESTENLKVTSGFRTTFRFLKYCAQLPTTSRGKKRKNQICNRGRNNRNTLVLKEKKERRQEKNSKYQQVLKHQTWSTYLELGMPPTASEKRIPPGCLLPTHIRPFNMLWNTYSSQPLQTEELHNTVSF